MKKRIIFTAAIALLASCFAQAAEYTLVGKRFLRKYTAPNVSQVYMAETDVQRIAYSMCDVPWTESTVAAACETEHAATNLDANVKSREKFDAALFCANHVGDKHVAYANAAVYRIEFPSGSTLPTLTSLSTYVYSDPYNVYGARISLIASDSDVIPTACATVRGDVAGGIKAAGVAPRITRQSGGKDYWYPNMTNLVFNASNGLSTPLQLRKYLYVFVLMENYATSRGNWIEGCSYVENAFKITTSADITGWSYGCDIAEPYATQYHLKDGHANEDADGDGLSNYAEYLITHVFKFATLDPDNPKTSGSCVDFFRRPTGGHLYFGEMFAGFKKPKPERQYEKIRLHTFYSVKRRVEAPVYAQAWSQMRDPDMSGSPDVVFKSAAYVINKDRTVDLAVKDDTSMELDMRGKFKLCVFADEDGDGKFTPGEPFGFVRDVELGADETVVPLTDDTTVFARFDILSGKYAAKYGVVSVAVSNETQGVTENARHTRIRVTRVLVDGKTTLGVDKNGHDVPVKQVVLDKYLDLGTRSYLHEGDFLTDGAFDVGWVQTKDAVYGKWVCESKDSGVPKFIDATRITYAIVIGEGDIDSGTNLIFRCVVNRVYDSAAARYKSGSEPGVKTIRPVIDNTQPQDYVYGARPTFRWAMQDGNGINYDSYTAFRLEIVVNGGTYDTGYRILPPRDATGWYVWTLDEPIGARIAASSNYCWRVSMYNAKYKDDTFWDDQSDFYAWINGGENLSTATWSDYGTFTVNMNNQQPMNDHAYSSIAAAVKYAGPETVLKSKVFVQAFATADFAGAPLGQTYATDKDEIADTSHNTANAVIKGLPQTGTYYVRAFIDSNGNGVLDDFESWGAAKEPVTLTAATLTLPTVGLYIEDADTDGDWIPDAYEYAEYSSLTNLQGTVIGGDQIAFKGPATYTGRAGISTGMEGSSLSVFQNGTFIRSMVNGMSYTVSIDAIRAAVSNQLNNVSH